MKNTIVRIALALIVAQFNISVFAQNAPSEKMTPKREAEILRFYQERAEAGDASSQKELADFYMYGMMGLEMNPPRAATWYIKAAEQGFADAQCALGNAYLYADGVMINATKARGWFEKCLDQGNPEAYYGLGRIYMTGAGVPVNHERAFELFSKGVEHNDVLSMWAVGQMYFDGNFVHQDYRRAREYWYRATDQRGLLSAYALGLTYRDGKGAEKSVVQALKWLNIAASRSMDRAVVAGMDLEKTATPAQISEANALSKEWLDRPRFSLWPFNDLLSDELNINVPKLERELGINRESEVKWIGMVSQACQNNGESSCYTKNIPLPRLKELAETNDAIFENKYAHALSRKVLSPEEEKEAWDYFKKAADAGFPHAQVTVGWKLLHGLGVNRNPDEAYTWNLKGALHGHPEGASNLGFQLKNGIGVTKNIDQAIRWYQYASIRGSLSALGTLRQLMRDKE